MTPSRPQRLEDDERPSSLLWFLAGGTGKPPTGAQLRAWKRRDREEKARQGWDVDGNNFWRELWRGIGWRFRKKVRREDEAKKDENGGKEVEQEVSAEAEPAEEESSEEETEGGEAADAERVEEGAIAAGFLAGDATGTRT
ncbi:MAG: hypothetical protein Q9213_007123 [Squamulea squamosa]